MQKQKSWSSKIPEVLWPFLKSVFECTVNFREIFSNQTFKCALTVWWRKGPWTPPSSPLSLMHTHAERRAHTPARGVGPRQPQQTLCAAVSVRSGGGRAGPTAQTVVMPQLREYTAALLLSGFASQLHFFWGFYSLFSGEQDKRRQPCVMARLCAFSPEL